MAYRRCPSIRERKNVENLTEKELTRFRDAMTAIQALPRSDNRSYEWIAAQHGCDQQHCPHHVSGFCTWHRAYLVALEMNLRAVDPKVTLPYWDWASPNAKGLPKAYTDKTYISADGKRKPNPLLNYTFSCPAGSAAQTTTRSPGSAADLQRLGARARASLNINSFSGFQDTSSDSIQNAHDGLHGWVGGFMATIAFSAYDPIFYAHHCNVDRIWAAWQVRHGNSTMPQAELDLPLTPWPLKGRDVLSTKDQLCYRYVYGSAESRQPAMTRAALESLAAEGPRTLNLRFSRKKVGTRFDTAELQLRQLHFPEDSYEVRVFVNSPDANDKTALKGNEHYAGSIYIFGHGECYGAEGHCDPVEREPGDVRAQHHLLPVDRSLDLTPAVRAAASQKKSGMSVTLVVIGPDGKQADYSSLNYDRVALITRD